MPSSSPVTTNNAAASPILIPSLSALKGRQVLLLIDSNDLKPLTVSCVKLSIPPAITTSAKPFSINALALINALPLDEQAVEIP